MSRRTPSTSNLTKKNGATVPKLRHKGAELVTSIGHGDGRAELGHSVAREHGDALRGGKLFGAEPKLPGKVLITPDEARRGNGSGRQTCEEALRQLRVAVVEGKDVSCFGWGGHCVCPWRSLVRTRPPEVIIDSQRSRHVERLRGNAAHRVWSVLRTSGGNLQPVMGTPLASGAALPRRACLRSRGDTVSAGSGRTSHNAADAPLQSTGGGTRSGTPWTGRSRRSGEDASQPHNKGLELRHEIADPTPKVLYATFRMRAPTHPKSVHPSLTPAQPCLGCLQIGPHSNQEKSLFE